MNVEMSEIAVINNNDKFVPIFFVPCVKSANIVLDFMVGSITFLYNMNVEMSEIAVINNNDKFVPIFYVPCVKSANIVLDFMALGL